MLGLELVPQAIVDAKENATINNIANCDFFAGRAEDILTSIMYRATKDDVIAIVDRSYRNPSIIRYSIETELDRLIDGEVLITTSQSQSTTPIVPVSRRMYSLDKANIIETSK